MLPPAAVLRIAAEFIELHGFSPDSLARSYLDLQRRKHAEATAPGLLQAALSAFEATRSPLSELERAVSMMKDDTPPAGQPAPARPPVLDYTTLAERYRGGKNRRRPGMTFG